MSWISSIRNRIFSDKDINTGRQIELDFAKAVVVFLLAAIHCIIESSSDEALESGVPYVFDTLIGGPLAAPVFMFSMGACILYSKRKDALSIIKRGIQLFICGFVLNICRYTIPYLIGYAITGDTYKYIDPLLYKTMCNDVLQFAGMACISIGIFIKLKLSDVSMFVISMLFSICGTFLNGTDVHNTALNIFIGYFVGVEDAAGVIISDFVYLNWLIVPVSGYIFGKKLKRVKDKELFYRIITPASVIICVIYYIIGVKNAYGMFGYGENCYYHIITPDVIIAILGVIGACGVYYYITCIIPDFFKRMIINISSHVMSVYCIHWVIIVYVFNIFIYQIRGSQELHWSAALIIAFCISVVSIIIANIWTKRLKPVLKNKLSNKQL